MAASEEEIARFAACITVEMVLQEITNPDTPDYTAKSTDTVERALGLVEKDYYEKCPRALKEGSDSLPKFTAEQFCQAFIKAGALKDGETDDQILVHKYLTRRFKDFF